MHRPKQSRARKGAVECSPAIGAAIEAAIEMRSLAESLPDRTALLRTRLCLESSLDAEHLQGIHAPPRRAVRKAGYYESAWLSMPEISRFFGIVVQMYYNDRSPAHFHVHCGEQKALIAIETPALLEGQLSPRVLGLFTEWAAIHSLELAENWKLGRDHALLKAIQPFEQAIQPFEQEMLMDIVEVRPVEMKRTRITGCCSSITP